MSALRATATAVGVAGVPSGGVRTGRRATSRFGAGLARGERAAVAPRRAASTRAACDDATARWRVSRRADAPSPAPPGEGSARRPSLARHRRSLLRSEDAPPRGCRQAAAAAINLDDVAVAGAAMVSVTGTTAPAREVVTPVSVIAAEAGLDVGLSSAAAENSRRRGPPRKSRQKAEVHRSSGQR